MDAKTRKAIVAVLEDLSKDDYLDFALICAKILAPNFEDRQVEEAMGSLLYSIASMYQVAKAADNAHMTIFKFSTHWKVMIGTPELSIEGRDTVRNLPHGDTLEDAINEYMIWYLRSTLGTKIDYREYIASPEWKARATEAKRRSGWRCQLCATPGNSKSLHVHHNNYENLGNEADVDLIVLCADCHAKFHNKLPRN